MWYEYWRSTYFDKFDLLVKYFFPIQIFFSLYKDDLPVTWVLLNSTQHYRALFSILTSLLFINNPEKNQLGWYPWKSNELPKQKMSQLFFVGLNDYPDHNKRLKVAFVEKTAITSFFYK